MKQAGNVQKDIGDAKSMLPAIRVRQLPRAHLAAIGCNGIENCRPHLAAIGCRGLICMLEILQVHRLTIRLLGVK